MQSYAPKSKQSGLTMLESLIAVVVLSVGLLGIAFVQLQSKHLNYQAMQRSAASLVANEIIERMRNNTDALGSYLTTVGGGTITTAPSPACNASANACLPAQLAARDIWQWEQTLDGVEELAGSKATGGLSQPTGCITGPAGGGPGTYIVSIAWRGQSTKSDVNANNCGKTSGKYDDTTGDNAYRRLLAINVFING